MNDQGFRRCARGLGAALCVVSVAAPGGAVGQAANQEFDGLTRPSRDVDLVMRVSGVLARLPVKSGQQVHKGEVIAELKSELEKQSLDIARLKAESDHDIIIAEKTRKLRETELSQLKELEAREAASKWEVETTGVQVEIEEARAETARFNKRLAEADYQREQLLLAERTLVAPFDGVILRTLKEEGEGVADLEPIAVLVRLDPIWVECNLPAELFGRIRVGGSASVRSVAPAAAETAMETPARESTPMRESPPALRGVAPAAEVSRDGTVIAADPLVDAASDTFRVVVEVPNPDGVFTAGRVVRVGLKD